MGLEVHESLSPVTRAGVERPIEKRGRMTDGEVAGATPFGPTPALPRGKAGGRSLLALRAQQSEVDALIERHGRDAQEAIRVLGVEDTVVLQLGDHPQAGRILRALPQLDEMVGLGEVRDILHRDGPAALHQILDAVGVLVFFTSSARDAESGPIIHQDLLGRLPLRSVAAFARATMFEKRDRELLSFLHLHGREGLFDLLQREPERFDPALKEAGEKLEILGRGKQRVYLLKGAVRPPAIAAKPPQDIRIASKQIRAMRDEIAARDPDLARELETELCGRRFVRASFYDALYADGIANPEQAYTAAAYESWREAEALMKSRAEQSRGRPLREGELTDLLCDLHRLVGPGMIATEQTQMTEDDLGRYRDKEVMIAPLETPMAGMVLGGELRFAHDLSPEQAATIDANPWLDARRVGDGDPALTNMRLIVCSRPEEIPRFMEQLDAWVRANEARLPVEELAAELHYRLCSIHPFVDGTGRTAKLLVDFLLDRAGIEPPIWQRRDALLERDTWADAVKQGVLATWSVMTRYRASLY